MIQCLAGVYDAVVYVGHGLPEAHFLEVNIVGTQLPFDGRVEQPFA